MAYKSKPGNKTAAPTKHIHRPKEPAATPVDYACNLVPKTPRGAK